MRRGVANYFEREQCAPSLEECEVVNVPVRYVPMVLSALETRKARSFWASDDDWYRGLAALATLQRNLLMPCGEDIIREIREARGPLNPGTGSTLEEYPVGDYPGFTLGDVARRLSTGGISVAELQETANARLTEIRDILQAQAAGEGSQLDALLQIVALLSV